MRFSYCACVISLILNDFSGIDIKLLKSHINKCTGYQGGISWMPFAESHAGLTFCAVGCLKLIADHEK
jgi:geranylgeranyl transferase type-1 subunit beta